MTTKTGPPPWSHFLWKLGPRCDTFTWTKKLTISEENFVPETLATAKNNIETCGPQHLWEYAKKITNPYELVYTYKKPNVPKNVSIGQPLSRSYFKIIEILKLSNFFHARHSMPAIRTAHVCEGPGGFIEGIHEIAGRLHLKVQASHAITLRSTEPHIPGWRRAQNFLHRHKQVKIGYGADGTGDILKAENRADFIQYVHSTNSQGVNIFTADGGFDFTSDYLRQEKTIFPLLCASIHVGLSVLAPHGLFVLKIFDFFEPATIELLLFLSAHFNQWTIYKPVTSRPCNSEHYFIGSGFRGCKPADLLQLERLIEFNGIPQKLFSTSFSTLAATEIFANTIKELNVQRSNSLSKQIEFLEKAQRLTSKWSAEGAERDELYHLWTECQNNSLAFCRFFEIYFMPPQPVICDFDLPVGPPADLDGTDGEDNAPLDESLQSSTPDDAIGNHEPSDPSCEASTGVV